MAKIVSIEDFGKDHWSLLAYIQTRCVDYGGRLDLKHMRTKNKALAGTMFPMDWKPEYGTRLSGFFLKGDKVNKKRRLDDHDDHDCQEDFEEAGLIENLGTGLHPAVKLTKFGFEIAAQIVEHKANGGQFASFKPKVAA